LCLDEPLSAVDRTTRDELYKLLEAIQRRTGVTVLHVTHSHGEARRLGDTILLFEEGRVRQAERPVGE
jgi:ABC-type proline/glycine betaine transport system ATPase subunit